jgi:hypothetical protein
MQVFVEKKAFNGRDLPLAGLAGKMVGHSRPVAASKVGFYIRVRPQPGYQIQGMIRRSGPFVVAVKM